MDGNGTGKGTGLGLKDPNVLHGNVHTGLRQGQEPNSLSPIVVFHFCICPGSDPVQYK